jgi:MFS family permease
MHDRGRWSRRDQEEAVAGRGTKELKNISLASLGGTLEYFDFQVYVFVAAALGADIFPPGDSVWKTQVQTFGIFAIGYLVRPIAGMIIAHYADRIGRKKLFVFTVLLMSVPTCLMGLLPTYAVAGWLAPVALLLLRILQGCAVGGELPGAAVFICEHATPRRLGLASGLFIGMVNAGLLLGAAAAFAARSIAGLDPAWASLAWRLPFIVGGLCGLLAAYLRRHLAESPLFEQTRAEKKLATGAPIATVLRQYRRQCAFAIALLFVFSTTPAIYFQWLPTYLIGIRHVPTDWVFLANLCGVAAFVLGMPLWGALRERLGWPRLLVVAGVLNAGSALWFFTYLPTFMMQETQLVLAVVVVGALCGVTHSLIAGLLSALFPTPIRQSGFAFPYSVGTAIFSGLTPLVVASLVRSYGLATPMWQELLAGGVAVILAGCLRFMPLYLGNEVAPERAPARPKPAPSVR